MQESADESKPRRLRVFLCHSSGDKRAVRDLFRKLRDDGFDPWLDEEELLPGQDWQDEIPRAIRGCEAVIVCLSRNSVRKEGYLQKEVREALSVAEEKPEDRIFIIPVKLEDVEVPGRLSRWQWADLRREDGYARLVNALSLRASQVGILASQSSLEQSPKGPVIGAEPQPAMPPSLAFRPQDEGARPALLVSTAEAATVKNVHAGAFPSAAQVGMDVPPEPFLTSRRALLAGLALASAIAIVVGVWSLTRPGTVKRNPKDGLKYIWVPPGTFIMGCSPGDSECSSSGNEKPAHRVSIGKGFWIGQTEVTVAAYRRHVGTTMPPAPYFNADWSNQEMPILNVTWDDAAAYCEWTGGRLPTEAEWEYAARAGKSEARYGPLDEIAWYSGNSYGRAHEVGKKRPNAFGLYDMLGNVSEWVNDWYSQNYYLASPERDPRGPDSQDTRGDGHVLRGDSWYFPFPRSTARVSSRHGYWPDFGPSVGFRCALAK